MVSVLLFYKFVEIADPAALRDSQRALCTDLGLKGRILIGSEGINGTVAGQPEAVERYKQTMWQDERFADLIFKESTSETLPFPKLKVKARPEIITLEVPGEGLDAPAPYLDPAELNRLYESGEEFYVFDMRNIYEAEVGAFEGAIIPDITYFRELPNVVDDYAELKDKKIVTYCTGGIRCEKASALLKARGFRDVYQLKDGIVNYVMQFPGKYFKGDCYVFDDRMQLSQEEIASGKLSGA